MNKIAALTVSLGILSTPASASEATFNEAVNLYLKGYAECREANTLRSDDIVAARKRFDHYLKILDRAAAIEPSILKTNERDMDANLTFCERVNNNLKMAEAAPTLETGFEHCEKARTALETQDVPSARQALDQYAMQRDQALSITPNIMEVFSLASRVRACARLEEKLAQAEQDNQAEAAALNDLQQQLTAFQQRCNQALSYTRQRSFTVDTIDQANRLLGEAQQHRKAANANGIANRFLRNNPERADTLSFNKMEAEAMRCETEVSSLIRNMTRQRRDAEQLLENAISGLLNAQQQCNKARQAPNPAQAPVKQLVQQANALLQENSTSNLNALANRHPTWLQSQTWLQTKTKTAQCLQDVNAKLTAARKPAPPPVTPPTALPLPQTIVTPIATQPTAAGRPSATKILPENDDAPAHAKGADWTDLAEEAPDEPAASTHAEKGKKQLRKSWTDLVQ